MDPVPTYNFKDERVHPILALICAIISIFGIVLWIIVRFINPDPTQILRGHPATGILIFSLVLIVSYFILNRRRAEVLGPKISNVEEQIEMLDEVPISVVQITHTSDEQNRRTSAIIDDVLGTSNITSNTTEAISKLMVSTAEPTSDIIKPKPEKIVEELVIPSMIELPSMIDLPPLDDD